MASDATGTTVGAHGEQQNEDEFCVMEDDEEDGQTAAKDIMDPPLVRQQDTPPPQACEIKDEKDSKLGTVKLRAESYDFKVKEEPIDTFTAEEDELEEPTIDALSPIDRRQETTEQEEQEEQDAPVEEDSTAADTPNEIETGAEVEVETQVKREVDADGVPLPTQEESSATPIPKRYTETYKVAHALMLHHCNSLEFLAASTVASMLDIGIDELKRLVDECNRFEGLMLVQWKPVPDERHALIDIKG